MRGKVKHIWRYAPVVAIVLPMVPSRTPEPLVVPLRRKRHRCAPGAGARAAVCGLLAFLAGCKDAPTDPMVGVVAQESEAALALGVSFPGPGSWVQDGTFGPVGAQALERWTSSWFLDPAQGHAARVATYASLAVALSGTVPPERIDEELARLSEGVRRARAILTDALPPRLAEGIGAAASYQSAAMVAWDRGDVVGAIERILRGSDALREVGPEAVARALVSEVEASYRRVSDGGPYSEKDFERLQRLVTGGREALAEGSWVLAIRRAYYARALMNGSD